MLYLYYFIRTVQVTTDADYGRSLQVISLASVLRGAVVSVQFETRRKPHTVIRFLLIVDAYLCLTNSVAVQSTLRAHAFRTSHNSLVGLRPIVHTLLCHS
jgi:hypothetical protein